MKVIITFLILVVVIFNIQAQWTVQQFYPDYYESFFKGDDISQVGFVVGEYGIIRKTTNLGQSWVNVYSGTTYDLNGIVFGVFADTLEGYVAGSSGLILKTTNGGANWIQQNSGVTSTLLDIDIGRGDTAIAVGTFGTVVRTTNGGVNWTSQTLGGGSVHLYGIYSYSFSSFYICDGSGRVYVSNNAGGSWTQYNTGVTDGLFSIGYLNLNYFACGQNGTIVRSTNSGVNWTVLSSGTTEGLNDVNVPVVNNVVVAASDGSILRSTNYGTNFGIAAPPANISLNDIEIASSLSILGFGDEGLIRHSSDYGANWSYRTYSLGGDITGIYFISPLTGFACASAGELFKTTDGGANWISSTYLGTYDLTSIEFATPATGYITGQIFPNLENGNECRIYRTTNGGLIWAVQGTINNMNEIYSIDFADASTGWFLGTNSVINNGAVTELYKTTNSGGSWSNVFNFNVSVRDIYFINSLTGWAAASGSNLARTTNGGLNWQQVSTPTSADYYSIMFLSQTQGYACGSGGVIITTTNSGQNWIQQTSGVTDKLNSIHFGSASNGICVGENGARLRTSNGGQTWINNREESIAEITSCFMPTSINAYAGGYMGYIANFGGIVTGIEPVSNIIPKEYMLEQNYPNPFNPATIIRFQITELSDSKLIVYDILGKEIAVLVNGMLNAGSYEVSFDGSSMPSGVYFYKLQTEKFTETKKMVLIK
jgi:photosystem II stability/assembly factor-like uncharacterized protein